MSAAAERREIVIAGGGFAGAILARALRAQGRDVLLLERGRHPRFALGESSTPLANLALERLALRYGFDDLWTLAAHGRWRRRLPAVRRGLKRGFCFYSHEPGKPFSAGLAGENRLIVAASPDNDAADNQWLRADVDGFLFERARAEGVDCREETAVEAVEAPAASGAGPLRIRAGGQVVEAGLLIDATGGSPLAGQLGASPLPPRLETILVFSHFDGVAPFNSPSLQPARSNATRWKRRAVKRGDGPRSPFPERWSAAHHLLEDGWMYQLRFDDGSMSAGVLLQPDRAVAPAAVEKPAGRRRLSRWISAPRVAASRSDCADRASIRRLLEVFNADPGMVLFASLLGPYPSLRAQFANCRSLRPVAIGSSVAYRRDRAAGPGWLLLPHSYAFTDPMFSTGIAWSLLAVERIAGLCSEGVPAADDLDRYSRLIATEADHIERLLAAAYRLMPDMERFGAAALAYFAAASFDELRQRLLDPPGDGWCWQGFLGADDPLRRRLFEQLDTRSADPRSAAGLAEWIGPAIERRNLIGLGDPARRNVYPVDLADMERRMGEIAARLEVTPALLRSRWPRLRSPDRMPTAAPRR